MDELDLWNLLHDPTLVTSTSLPLGAMDLKLTHRASTIPQTHKEKKATRKKKSDTQKKKKRRHAKKKGDTQKKRRHAKKKATKKRRKRKKKGENGWQQGKKGIQLNEDKFKLDAIKVNETKFNERQKQKIKC